MEIKLNINVAIVDSIISQAGYATQYWASEIKSEAKNKTNKVMFGGSIIITDGEEGKDYLLDKEKLLKGIQQFMQYKIDNEYPINLNNLDTNDMDIIIQYSIFNEVMYQ